MAKAFTSQAGLEAKQVTLTQLSPNAYAYTAEGGPNSGVIIGDGSMLIVDTTATPAIVQDPIARTRVITDKPTKYMALSYYHMVCVLGVSAYFAEGAQNIIASHDTYEMIVGCGEADMKFEIECFPRLSAGMGTMPGLTWPTLMFEREPILLPGKLEAKILHLGPGHTKGSTVMWVPSQKVLLSDDLAEHDTACYCGDAQPEERPVALDALHTLDADKLALGRGPALLSPGEIDKDLAYIHDFVSTLLQCDREAIVQKVGPKAAMAHTCTAMDPKFGNIFICEHRLPSDVTCTFDEASGIKHPRTWTAEHNEETWATLQG